MSTKKTATPAAATSEKLDTVLGLATSTAKGDLGEATNRSVTAKATLDTSVTDGGETECTGVEASVSLGVKTHKTGEAKAKA